MMRYKQVPKELVEETKALILLALFLRNEIGLKEVFSAKELRQALRILKDS